MTKLKDIVGKTIKAAIWSGREFSSCDNRVLELTFTDGTAFSFNVNAVCEAEMTFHPEKNGKPETRKI